MFKVALPLALLLLAAAPLPAATWTFTNSGVATLPNGAVQPAGYTNFTYTNNGTVNVLGSSTIGSTTATLSYKAFDWVNPWNVFVNGGTAVTGAVLNVGDATHNAVLTLADTQAHLYNHLGNTVNLAAGSKLSLLANPIGNLTKEHWAGFKSFGTFNWGGKVEFSPAMPWNGNYIAAHNYGRLEIVGDGAVLERLPKPAGVEYKNEGLRILNEQTGTLAGNGKITYVNSTGNAAYNIGGVLNYGTIAPGTLAAPGTLEFVNMYVNLGSWGKMAIRLGGTGQGQYDSLAVSGMGAGFGAASHAALELTLINGFTPSDGDSWSIVRVPQMPTTYLALPAGYTIKCLSDRMVLTYGSLKTGDANIDKAVDDDDLSLLLANWGTGTKWDKGNFNSTGVTDDDDLSLLLSNWTGGTTTIPEPATIALLVIGAGLVRRRQQTPLA